MEGRRYPRSLLFESVHKVCKAIRIPSPYSKCVLKPNELTHAGGQGNVIRTERQFERYLASRRLDDRVPRLTRLERSHPPIVQVPGKVFCIGADATYDGRKRRNEMNHTSAPAR